MAVKMVKMCGKGINATGQILRWFGLMIGLVSALGR